MKKLDTFAESWKTPFSVIPAEAGIQSFQTLLDSRLRGRDEFGDFLRSFTLAMNEDLLKQ